MDGYTDNGDFIGPSLGRRSINTISIFYVLKNNKENKVYWKSENFSNFPTLVS